MARHAGYDRIADRHLAWMNEIRGDPRLRFLHALIARLPDDPVVLDLGCGAGIPCTAILAERGAVTGVDVSARQLELARAKVPGHVPSVRHAALFGRVAAWLRPGGHFLAALACSGGADDTVTMAEPEGPATFQWVIASKP